MVIIRPNFLQLVPPPQVHVEAVAPPSLMDSYLSADGDGPVTDQDWQAAFNMLCPEGEQTIPQLFLVPKPKWFERLPSEPTGVSTAQKALSQPRSKVIVPLEDTERPLLFSTPPVGGSALDRFAYRIFMGQLGELVPALGSDPSSLYGQYLPFVGEAPRFDPSYVEDLRHDAMHPAARKAKARWFLREPSPAIGDSGETSSAILDDLSPGALRDRVEQAWFRGGLFSC